MTSIRRLLGSPDAPATGVALALLGMFGWFALRGGAYEIQIWGLGGMAVIALAASVVLGSGGLPRKPTRTEAIALAALAGLALWSAASLLWARVPGDAWTGADRAILYLAIFALVLILPWRRLPALTFLAGYVFVIAGIAGVTLVRARHGDAAFFLAGRLSFPVGYPNATSALFLSGYWVAVILATRRGIATALRASLLGIAGALPQVALLSQSRGSLVAFPITALVLIAVVPGRVRTAIGILITLLPVALGWSEILSVRDAFLAGSDAGDALAGPLWTIVVGGVVLALVGGIWAGVDARIELSRRAARMIGMAGLAVAGIAVLAAAVVVAVSHPVDRAQRGWDEFTALSNGGGLGYGLGTNRYDFWRAGLGRFRDNPLLGIGADNFAHDYILLRRSLEEPAYPHSLEVQVISQLGAVGGFLALALLIAVGVGMRPRRRDDSTTSALAAAALAPVVYWLFHASIDWFWEIPGVTAPVVGLAALGMSVRSGARVPFPIARSGMAAVACATAAAAVALALPWSAARLTSHGLALWRSDPERAYSMLDRAARLDGLSASPLVAAGAIAARKSDHARMEQYFSRAAARDPDNWYIHLELALAASMLKRGQVALHEVGVAVALNPRDEVLRDIASRLRRGEAIDLAALDRVFSERVVGRSR